MRASQIRTCAKGECLVNLAQASNEPIPGNSKFSTPNEADFPFSGWHRLTARQCRQESPGIEVAVGDLPPKVATEVFAVFANQLEIPPNLPKCVNWIDRIRCAEFPKLSEEHRTAGFRVDARHSKSFISRLELSCGKELKIRMPVNLLTGFGILGLRIFVIDVDLVTRLHARLRKGESEVRTKAFGSYYIYNAARAINVRLVDFLKASSRDVNDSCRFMIPCNPAQGPKEIARWKR